MATRAGATDPAVIRRQRIVRARRQYNQWVRNDTLEDYALRFTANKARRWSAGWVANTALGSIAFLACETIGATVTLGYGFANTGIALLIAGVIFLLAGLPICFYGARYGVDMDLLTRGAGFGYLGSTITSALYTSFTFILFAIEAVILSAALNLCFGLPLPIGHIVSALIVLPVAAYGFRRISQLQNWTQPAWLLLQLAPLAYVLSQGSAAFALWSGFEGQAGGLSLVSIGLALAVFLSLLPQIGEQVDYLRFLPRAQAVGKLRWWAALLATGPGWIVMGAFKILTGSVLAVLALRAGLSAADASNPTALYFMTFQGLTDSRIPAIALTGLFVAICQIKINVTNAYAGSIASSNFFSRLTHRHPGRVIWLVFNVLVALMLMEGGIQTVVERVLALYSNFAVAWFGAVTADLMINKPLGLSPRGIEFRRAHLYDINPVGVGAMLLSLIASTLCFVGLFGPVAAALSPLIGLAFSFLAAPLIAWTTRGRYYIAREAADFAGEPEIRCSVCEAAFEPQDMAHCPVYQGAICSLCCTLEARCHDACKVGARVVDQGSALLGRLLPRLIFDAVHRRIVRFLLLYAIIAGAIGIVLILIYYQQAQSGIDPRALGSVLRVVYACLLVLLAFISWYFVLAQESQRAAEDETDRQTMMLIEEIEAHRQTDAELQRAKEVAEAANLAKSRYIVGVSHEIRSPLNTISGYAQLLERDPTHRPADAVRVIRRSTSHLVNLVDGLLDIARIENGSLRIERNRINLGELLDQIVDMFSLQAAAKGLRFDHDRPPSLPDFVFTDEKRLRQILINLISNAIKYTPVGGASLIVRWRDPVAEFDIVDTGVGIAEPDLERIFEPFERVGNSHVAPGIGLGLTITRLLAEIMGGHLSVQSQAGSGSIFRLKLFLSSAPAAPDEARTRSRITGYAGPRRRILVTDDDPAHRAMVGDLLEPLGFALDFASEAAGCLERFARKPADLVMLDIAMPGDDGWTTARTLRARHGEEPAILMVSANVHDFQRPRREDDPHDDFLTKPFELDELLDRIGLLLDIDWIRGED
ncbi:ATP-binding protein [Flavisphingomonas formosensis]|uniref:ATP-binding protein n=1 Tax=Flavisphingomonas formosensis TaxID=861534 RepID=UPI0012FC6DB3|nr:ATP-binding protein [Sphingomonas formosensis]